MPTLSTTFSALLLALVPLSAHAFQVTAPADPALCAPIPLTWTTDSTAPYKLYLVHDGQPISSALETFTVASGTSATWIADIGPPGTFLTVIVEDAQGIKAFSGRLTIQPGSNNCTVSTTGAPNVGPASTLEADPTGTPPPVLAESTTSAAAASLSPAATLAVSSPGSSAMPSTSQMHAAASSGTGSSASASATSDPSVKANSAAGSLVGTVLITFGAAVAFAGVGAALL